MWMPIFPLLAVLFLAAPSRSDDYDLIDKEDDQVVNDLSQIDTGIQLQMKHSKQCSRPGAGWKCKTGCYQSFLNTSGPLPNKCGSPISGDVCFGQELTYAHLETPSPFPLEYQILQNFPRCWAQLAPLICAVHYRPCVKQQVAFRAGDVGKTKVQTAIAELWSNLRAGYCYETVRVCQDVIKAGYFPSFINCSSSATQNSSIFTDSCSISSLPVPFKFSSNCPEPMVFFEGRLRGARPIMDQCYLKCRSDHFDRESRLYQNIYQATVGSGLTIVFLAAFFYLHFFSEAQRRSIVVFAASQSFLAISIWTTMWSLGSFLYHEVDCIEAGSHWIRRTEKPTDFLHWCVTQSMLINFAYSSAYLWLAAVAFFGLNCPSWLRKNEKTDFGWNVRSILLFGNYLTSGAVCIFLQLFHLHESDGVSGICLPGLQSTYSFWSLLAIPALSTSFIALSIGLYYRKYKIFWNESIGDGKRIASELHKYETEKRRKFLERVMRVKNPTAEQLRDVEERLVQNAIDDDLFSVNTIPDGPDDIAADKLMGSENPAGYLHRLVNSTKSSRNVARIKSGLPETLGDDEMEEIVDDAALHSVSKFVDHYWRHRQQFYLSFGFHWLLTASVLAIFVIWTSIPLHYFLIRNDPLYEEQSVRDYVHCALNSSISQKQTEWIHSGRPNAAFSNCNLSSYLPSQRASYILLVFILFPTAPFLILIASIAAGLCGRGGMKTVSSNSPSQS